MEWLKLILPLYPGWKSDTNLSVRIWDLTCKVFTILLKQATNSENITLFYSAYHLANLIPMEGQHLIPSPDFLQVALEIAHNYEKQDKIGEAAATLEYCLFALQSSQRGLERYLNFQINEYTSRLFEQLGLLVRADLYLHEAGRDATLEQKTKISHRRYSFHEMMSNMSAEEKGKELQIWVAHLNSYASQENYIKWLNQRTFTEYIEQTASKPH